MHKIFVSACLLGEAVRYDGGDCRRNGRLSRWRDEGRLVALCPEVAGGLSVPRAPAEIQPDGRVITIRQDDVSEAFATGAEAVLEACRQQGVHIAILKEGSPSCGSHLIHDGAFSGNRIAGQGVTTRLLQANGIRVFSEEELDAAAAELARLEAG